jgi:hypothetical protein
MNRNAIALFMNASFYYVGPGLTSSSKSRMMIEQEAIPSLSLRQVCYPGNTYD